MAGGWGQYYIAVHGTEGSSFDYSTKLAPASVAQLDAPSNWRPGGREFNPHRGWQHSFLETDHEIFSTVILSLQLIQEGQMSTVHNTG